MASNSTNNGSSNSTNTSSGSSSSGRTIDGGVLAIIIVSITVGAIVLTVIAKLVFKWVSNRTEQKKANKYRDLSLETSHNSNAATNVTENPNMPLSTVGFSQLELRSMDRFLDEILKERPIKFTSLNLRSFTRNFLEKIGSGGFGVVYKAQLPNGVQIAVKVLNSNLEKKAEEQFMAEVGTIGRTYHIHLVRLYGFCFEPSVKALVYEYVENGSLEQHLFNHEEKIGFDKLHEIAIGTAKGIRYLHEECEQRIVHYDIKPGNVLLTASFSPKVADFGLAKLSDRENTHVTLTGARGTAGYAAPELWMPLPVTHKCDVYSFGMLLFELIGRRRNLNIELQSQEWYPKWIWQKINLAQIDEIFEKSEIEEKCKHKAERMCKVALWCVQYRPDERPSMSDVVRMLEGEDEIKAPMDPFAYLAHYSFGSVTTNITTTDSSSVSTGAHG
ncbi:hypothetical protein LUZ60_002614 [Juncus effusus]|nr:hypothetical protein LUZ60_002614 [Juncus effusus]